MKRIFNAMVVKGRKLTLREHWNKLLQELEGMTLREKLEHLWEYYKWVLGVLLGVVFVICAIVTAVSSSNMQVRFSGALINVDISPDGYVWLQDGYFAHIDGQEGKEEVNLRNMQFENPYTTVDQTFALDVQESVLALMNARELDYLLFDEVALPFFLDPESIMDLRELFTEEQLDALGTAVIRLQIEDTGEEIPVAIDVTDTAMFRDYMESDRTIYLAFCIVTPHKESCLDFWKYIKGGETENMQTVLAGTAVDVSLSKQMQTALTWDFFEEQGYKVGDHRVDLTSQSIQTENAEDNALVRADVLQRIENGDLDYLLCTDTTLLEQAQLLDLSQVLTAQELEALKIVYRNDVPVAVVLTGMAEGGVYLAFSANTPHLEASHALWRYIAENG